ncbi:restriction endonuclease subunit S [Enterococcus cecorum]|uniref:restriction endonuclease subunit S n=1 Tax=Enterococcus cecorum TaxID=44008 RepID=UPI001FAC8673|nr:restriction endonuclease subunit S [Enterococcus cecorum]MCJ0586266.1 restriction endonuclease subunit S [Enterococcus cecorum]
MNEKKKLQPKVRFREFTGENAPDWEQRKLGEITERVKGNDGRMDLPTLTISASEGWLDQRKRFSSNIAGKEQKNYTLLKKGQLSYNHGNSKLAKYGVVYSLKNYEEALVPRVYHSFTVNSSINSDFIELVFATKLPDRELGKLVTSGARMDGLLNINYDDFMGIVITIPKIDEQKRIRNLFNMINKLITLHQRKLEQLEQLKNTLLSKMFPKSGTNIPEIRFSGFTDAWKQRKLEEIIVKEIKGKAKSENISTNFANKGSLYLDTEYLNGGKPKYVSLPSDTDENDIIILWDGSQAGKLYKGVVGALGSTLKAYKIPEHTLFYYYQMLGSQEKIYNQYRTPNIPHVVKSFTSEFMIWDTSNDEKTLIIDIYSNLFNYIAIHQRKLDQLKNLKQTLLNKRFI